MPQITIWTHAYNAFVMGGDPHAPISATIEVESEPVPLGKGFEAYVIQSPNGETYVVEKTTGAIIGQCLEEIRADVATATLDFLNKQIEAGHESARRRRAISAEDFWSKMATAKGD